MTQEQKDFETKYHYKIVKPLGNYYKIPIKEYIVTSALLNWEDDNKTTIFAIKALDYSLENKQWITFHIGSDEFEKCMADFEVIKDGFDEHVKPVIISEHLITHYDEEGEDWLVYFSDYYKDEKFVEGAPVTNNLRIPKNKDRKDVYKGLNEYMIIYKSVFDLGKPSVYMFTIPPNLEYKENVLEWVKLFREDVLSNQVFNGINKRLMVK